MQIFSYRICNMKLRPKTTILATIFGCSAFFASDLFAASTTWTLLNQGPLPVIVTCESQELAGLRNAVARFQSSAIAPGASFSHNWGSAWYNDGMGLNAGTFTCHGTLSSGPGSVKDVTFYSDWNEAVSISLSKLNGQFVLTKTPQHPREKIARSKE